MPISVRHELKYYISQGQYQVLSGLLSRVLWPDEHADENNEYHIRSLYFDNVFDTALMDKIAGVSDREKYRIRIYNFSDKFISMECKTKIDSYISKRSVPISRELCEQLTAADPSGLENAETGLLRDVFREMRLRLLHPVVVVDYVREAYMHPAEEVRITFDKQLRSGMGQTDIFNKALPVYPPLADPAQIIMEVKFNRVLPDYISQMLSAAAGWASRSAISKYTMCRAHEGLDY
ncbi:MAG: polyphosphate polymerase domain-containing protein [Christensenellales bacterium]